MFVRFSRQFLLQEEVEEEDRRNRFAFVIVSFVAVRNEWKENLLASFSEKVGV